MMKFKKWFRRRVEEIEPGPESETGKMISCVSIVGVTQPEKLAQGLCPNCRALIDLWLTEHGLELSINGEKDRP